jgi:aminopeptidase N
MKLALALLLASLPAERSSVPPELRLPAGPRPTLYELELRVVPTEATFSGEVRVHLDLPEATSLLWLNATGLEVGSARLEVGDRQVGVRVLPTAEDFLGFAFERPVGPGAAVLSVSYTGPIDDGRPRGLYRVQEPDGEWYAYTLFEPIDARRVFPCFDEPAYKVPWRVELRVREGDTALANAPVESVRPAGDGTKRVSFARSKPLPSYLVAFVVGPFDVVESGAVGRQGVPLRFVVPRGRGGELRYAREVTPKVVGLLEDYFDLPFPFEKLDVAVLPRWNAMEHPGLVAMGQTLTLIKPAEETASRRRDYANILVHELAHYWFGDYVTHAWWDDIWLNEALATWLDAKLTERLDPSWRYAERARTFTAWAKQTDALASARAVRQPIRARGDIESAFDADTTYSKGAAVIGMFESWLGEAVLRDGIRRYLGAHAWGSATFADFARSLDEAAGRRVSVALATFLDQPGLPLVSASLDCSGSSPRLRLRQERLLTLDAAGTAARSWAIPVCVRWPAVGAARRSCALLEAAEQELALEAPACPAWLSLNDGDAGYYRVSLEDGLRHGVLAELARGGASALSSVERMAILDDLEALARAGRVPLLEALQAAPAALQDPDAFVAVEALDLLQGLRPERLPERLRGRYARMLEEVAGARARRLGWAQHDGDPADTHLLRQRLVGHFSDHAGDVALRAEARRLALRWLDDRSVLDSELAWSLLDTAASWGDRALYDRLLAEARRTGDRGEQARLLWALGRFRDRALSAEALSLMLKGEWSLQESITILWAQFTRVESQDRAWSFLKAHFEEIRAGSTDAQNAWLIRGVVSRFCDEAQRSDAAAFFGPRVAAIDGAALSLANGLERADACIAEMKRDAPAVEAFLGQWSSLAR